MQRGKEGVESGCVGGQGWCMCMQGQWGGGRGGTGCLGMQGEGAGKIASSSEKCIQRNAAGPWQATDALHLI